MPSLRPYFVIWTGQALSLLGSQAVQFALIWWLTLRSGSAAVLAAATFVGLLPQVVLGPFIGAWVDRGNRKRIMLWADGVVAIASAVLAVMFVAGAVQTAHILLLMFVRAVGGAFHQPAMTASTSLMVPKDLLTRIQGLNQALQGGQLIVSAPLGALLVATLPMAGVMIVDVITALVAIVPLLFVNVPQPERSEAGEAGASTLSEVRAGLHYLRTRAGHTRLLAMSMVINLCMVPAFALLPLLVLELGGGAGRLGWMQSIFGVGTIAGGVLLGVWGGFERRISTTLAGLLGIGAATLLLGASGSLGPATIALVGVGVLVPLVNGPIHALLQATVAPDFQGRVFALYGALATLMTPIGLALAAPAAELFGVRAWYVAGGVACLAMGVVGFMSPSLLQLETHVSSPGSARRPAAGCEPVS